MNKDARPAETQEEEEDHFLSLRSLLDTVDLATLATAIEKDGIYTWDRFGRFMKADETSKEKSLSLLATVYEYESNIDGQNNYEEHPLDISSGPGDIFSSFGWERDTLPDFKKIKSLVPELSKPLKPIKRKATDDFIAALMRLIVDLAKRDPSFNIEDMPGTKRDLFEVAQKKEADFKEVSYSTFETYIKPFLKFGKGSRSLNYYQEKLGISIQNREEDPQ